MWYLQICSFLPQDCFDYWGSLCQTQTCNSHAILPPLMYHKGVNGYAIICFKCVSLARAKGPQNRIFATGSLPHVHPVKCSFSEWVSDSCGPPLGACFALLLRAPHGESTRFPRSKGWLCSGFAHLPRRCPGLAGNLDPKAPSGGLQPDSVRRHVVFSTCCVLHFWIGG